MQLDLLEKTFKNVNHDASPVVGMSELISIARDEIGLNATMFRRPRNSRRSMRTTKYEILQHELLLDQDVLRRAGQRR